jgi:Xaa-Pro aminopeptidase
MTNEMATSFDWSRAVFRRSLCLLLLAALVWVPQVDADAQEAKRRWERLAQIRRDKFDLVLPDAMRENEIDMWITVVKEGYRDPLWLDLGQGYVGGIGYYIFSDRGVERIERAALGVGGYLLERSGAYDIVSGGFDLREFVAERDPQRIGLNMSHAIGGADGLTHTAYAHLVETLGEPYASRFVSAEKLVSDFRSRRVATEIAAFAEAGEISRELAERALSNEVITPGVTALEDVSWWVMERLHDRGLDTSFGMPSIYITGPEGVEATSNERIIQRGDLLMMDWGVGFLNMYTDMKRIAYVLREGETEVPAGLQNAFDQGIQVREVIRKTIKPGPTAGEMLERVNAALEEVGFEIMAGFNTISGSDKTEVIIGCHSVGNLGHGVGPSIAWFNPLRMTFEIKPSNMFSIELFAYTANPDWGGAKVRIPLEDDAIVTERGVEWLYPVNEKILRIR